MKAYQDHNRHFYLSPDGQVLIARNPKIKFADCWPRDLVELPDEMVPRVVEGFLKCADLYGGYSLPIYLIKEDIMSSKSNFLVILAGVIAGNYGFQKDADKAVAEGGALVGGTVVDEAAWGKLSVAERCKLARPLLSEKEAAKTQDGEGFAKSSWKVASRFKNPRPAAGEKEGKKDKPPKEPRAKGIKTLIFEMFNGAPGENKALSVEEIMAETKGTKASVTTAISDLRSVKYAGKAGTLNLVRVGDKYAREGSKQLKTAQDAAAKATKEADEKKAKDKKDADAKKAADAKAAKDAADKKAADAAAAKKKETAKA